MNVVAQIAVVLAGLVHVLIFAMESLLFTRAQVYRRFRTRAEDVATVRQWAFNQAGTTSSSPREPSAVSSPFTPGWSRRGGRSPCSPARACSARARCWAARAGGGCGGGP